LGGVVVFHEEEEDTEEEAEKEAEKEAEEEYLPCLPP